MVLHCHSQETEPNHCHLTTCRSLLLINILLIVNFFFSSLFCRTVRQRISTDKARDWELNLYQVFKEALFRLMDKIEGVKKDQNSRRCVILVQGVPTVGKSSLANCLAYYLALVGGQIYS